MAKEQELIETLWNVNNIIISSFTANIRINRNIVECKFEYKKAIIDFDGELIETLWNVNISDLKANFKWITELIETLWNVNVKRQFIY